MPVVIYPCAQAVRPVSAVAGVTGVSGGRLAGRARHRAVLARLVTRESHDAFVSLGVVGIGVVENGFL